MSDRNNEKGAVDQEQLEAFLSTAPPELQGWAEQQRTAASHPVKPGPEPKPQIAKNINKVLVALLVAAIVLLVKEWGTPPVATEANPNVAPHGDMSGASSGMTDFAELDTERETELKAQIEKNPDDVDARYELGKMYSDSGLWQQAQPEYEAVLEREPEHLDALLADGVIQFNLGEIDEAVATWQKAADVAPDRVEPQFNLGFAHLAKEPSDKDSAIAAWKKVIELEPDSDLAKTAQSHIDGVSKES